MKTLTRVYVFDFFKAYEDKLLKGLLVASLGCCPKCESKGMLPPLLTQEWQKIGLYKHTHCKILLQICLKSVTTMAENTQLGSRFFPTNLGEQIGAQSNLPSPLSPQEKGQKDVEKVVFFLDGKYISRTPNITYVLLLSGLGLYKLYNDPKYP